MHFTSEMISSSIFFLYLTVKSNVIDCKVTFNIKILESPHQLLGDLPQNPLYIVYTFFEEMNTCCTKLYFDFDCLDCFCTIFAPQPKNRSRASMIRTYIYCQVVLLTVPLVFDKTCATTQKRKKSCFWTLKKTLKTYARHRPLNHSAFNYSITRYRKSVPVSHGHQHQISCSEVWTQETMQLLCTV